MQLFHSTSEASLLRLAVLLEMACSGTGAVFCCISDFHINYLEVKGEKKAF